MPIEIWIGWSKEEKRQVELEYQLLLFSFRLPLDGE